MNAILNFVRVAGNILLHSFSTAAFCWAAIGLAAVVLVVRGIIKKKESKKA